MKIKSWKFWNYELQIHEYIPEFSGKMSNSAYTVFSFIVYCEMSDVVYI
jgi:hypothetical protein